MVLKNQEPSAIYVPRKYPTRIKVSYQQHYAINVFRLGSGMALQVKM
jgi:hypothetical protein